jgi:hypothetical protein
VSLRQKLSDFFCRAPTLVKDDRVSGAVGWLILLLYVVAYDAYAIRTRKIETLTRSFWRSTEKIIPGTIFIGVWIALSAHLLIEKPVRKRFFRGGECKIVKI